MREPWSGTPNWLEAAGSGRVGFRRKEVSAMTTTTHKRSVHIDAPVETVFDYAKDPHHFYEAFPEKGRPVLVEVNTTPEGVGSTYTWEDSMFMIHIKGTVTRESCIPNERIVDHSSTGPVWTYTFEPDQTGTTLSLACEVSSKVPLADKVIDRVAWDGDRDLDTVLANMKKAIET
jgi:uncharacterized protein YndB with AHSA1/START domain